MCHLFIADMCYTNDKYRNNRASKLQNKSLSRIDGVLYAFYDRNSGKKLDMFPGRVEYIEWMSGKHLRYANI